MHPGIHWEKYTKKACSVSRMVKIVMYSAHHYLDFVEVDQVGKKAKVEVALVILFGLPVPYSARVI